MFANGEGVPGMVGVVEVARPWVGVRLLCVVLLLCTMPRPCPELTLLTVPAFRSTSSSKLLVRPQKKNSNAARTTIAIPPTAIPAIAPLESPCCLPSFVSPTVPPPFPTPVLPVMFPVPEVPSAGNGSPGFSIYALSFAFWCCCSISWLLFGFTAPTIP